MTSATKRWPGAVPRPPSPRYKTTSSATSGVGTRHGDSACSDEVTMSPTQTARIMTIARCALMRPPRSFGDFRRRQRRTRRLRLARHDDEHVAQLAELDDGLHLGVLIEPEAALVDLDDLADGEIAREEAAEAARHHQVALGRLVLALEVLDARAIAIAAGDALDHAAPAGARDDDIDRRLRIGGEQHVAPVAEDALHAPDDAGRGDPRHARLDVVAAAIELDAHDAEEGRGLDGDDAGGDGL